MTFAPPTIKAVRAVLKGEDADLDDTELGIVGGPSHVRQGTSYHLGADQLIMSKNPYSARTARDRAGLSNAASALDIDDDLDELRPLSVWLVDQCRAMAKDTFDIREIIYSPDGVNVFRWDRERGVTSAPVPDSDLSHRTHTHISWYRDSEFRDKTAVFKRFFGGDEDVDAEDVKAVWQYYQAPPGPMGPGGYNVLDHLLWAEKRAEEAAQLAAQANAKLDKLGGPAPVDPAALKAVLLDPEVLAALAKAVNDDAHRRTAE